MNGKRPLRSSVIVIVLITLLFTSVALTAFIEKAGNDLMVQSRDSASTRLRQDAFSALEVTLGVLEDFREADSGLHGVAEGWGDPLGWAGWAPAEGRTVDIAFQDESGKLPLRHVDMTTLTNLFEYWQMAPSDAKNLADALLGWMQNGYVYSTPLNPDYEQASVPYDAPGRPLRSFRELAAIDVAKDVFFDPETKQPNANYWRFVNDVSIFTFPHPNVNGANADVLTAAGNYTDVQEQHISDYLSGAGEYTQQGQQWFKDTTTLAGVAGVGGSAAQFTTSISALRILITVHEGRSQYRLSVVVAPQGGATLNQTVAVNATAGSPSGSASGSGSVTNTSQPSSSATTAQASAAASQNLNYPFTILELLEDDRIPLPPPLPPPIPGSA